MPNKIFKSLFFIVITASLSFGSVLANAEVGSDAAAKMKVERCFELNHIDKNSKQIPLDVRKNITACVLQGNLNNKSKNELLTSSNETKRSCGAIVTDINALVVITEKNYDRYQQLLQEYLESGC